MSIINILHLSDLHIGEKIKKGSIIRIEEVIDNLSENLRFIASDSKWKPKYLCISGDIAHGGETTDYESAEKLIRKIIKATGIADVNIIIAPGNHDKYFVNKDDVGKSVTEERVETEKLVESYIENADIGIFEHAVQDSFAHYNEFCKRIKVPKYSDKIINNNFTFGTKFFEEDNLLFLIFNSCWFSFSGASDYGRMYLGNQIVKNIHATWKNYKENKELCVISVLHHGKNWFKYSEKFNLDVGKYNSLDLLEEMSDIILTGHDHGNIINPDLIGNKVQTFSGGATFGDPINDNHFHTNNCSILKIDKTLNKIERKALLYKNTKESHFPEWKSEEIEKYYLFKNINIDELLKKEKDYEKLEDENKNLLVAINKLNIEKKALEETFESYKHKSSEKNTSEKMDELFIIEKIFLEKGFDEKGKLNELVSKKICEKRLGDINYEIHPIKDISLLKIKTADIIEQFILALDINYLKYDENLAIIFDNVVGKKAFINVYFYIKGQDGQKLGQYYLQIRELRVKYNTLIKQNILAINNLVILEYL